MNPRLIAFEGWLGATSTRPLAVMSEGWLSVPVTVRRRRGGGAATAPKQQYPTDDEDVLLLIFSFMHTGDC
jgi:hypothetical protein